MHETLHTQCTDTSVPEVGGADPELPRAGIARRRALLTGAGIAGAALLARAGVATAADGDGALVGEDNAGDAGPTVFRNTSTATTDVGGAEGALVGDVTGSDNGSHAITGTTAGDGAGVAGDSAAGVGGQFVGGAAALRLLASPSAPSGPPTENTHRVGELYVDADGDLYYNPADGANFTKLNGQGGIVMLPDAQRAFDSREEFADPPNTNKGRFTAGETRAIDLSEFTDLPGDANGALVNLTVSGTGQAGYLTVFNGDTADDDRPNASSINWYAPGSIVANGITIRVGAAGIVKVYALQETEVIIDVIGYVT